MTQTTLIQLDMLQASSSLASFIQTVPHVLPTMPSKDVDMLFTTTSAESIVVCDSLQRVRGMVMKAHFYQQLGQRFGTQLYLGRPITLLMDDAPLIVSHRMEPMEAIDLALSRPEDRVYDPVVVTEDDRFIGILTMRDILSMSRTMQKQAEALRKETLTRTKAMVERIQTLISGVVRATEQSESESTRMTMFTSEGRQVLERVNLTLESFLMTNNQQQTRIDVLASRIEDIQEIARVISQFAEQSRLLTLNAQIEAARSGQHGRGFSVIANEIGHLADMTQHRTRDVNQIVNQIIEDVHGIVAFNDDTRNFSGQTAEAVDVALRVFNDLFQSVSTQNDNVTLIRDCANDARLESIRVTGSLDELTGERVD
ncbi:methyl-accepting chemotaxis protein [Alicyclobacillus acidiphilus]|uniref:methyl-accepting chemotaxis protein n=1 Tax=Alicyclobacillus acidiphilus TaxID=182455 RepID=UPI00082E2F6D|nr:methyl-accepting chemotaxis protein [Alicyclobacillus acidiphilus]